MSSSGGSAAVSPGGTNYLPPPSPEGDSVTALRRQLEELSASVEEERSQRAELERTIAELRGSPQKSGAPRTDDRYRRSLEEEKSRRIGAEKTVVELRAALAVAGSTGGQGEVTRAELDKVRRSYEVALARAKHEAELAAREELSLKLAQVNTFLEEQLQQQSRLEQLRCTSESQLRQDFQQTRGKLLGELAKVQATLKARNDEDRRLRKQLCSSPRSDAVGNRMADLITHLSPCHHEKPASPGGRNEHSAALRPAAAVLSMLMPPLVAQQSHAPGGSSGVCGYTNLLRRELEASVRKAAEAADREQPILTSITDPDDEQLAILKKKYFL
ncbi:hypothetical protein B566_EDAN018092 [Ephemera danica]|nr:hypothetical protein B566_EDAN018092 [Ephemera danica]